MRDSAGTDRAIASIAGERWGVITWQELRAAGLSASTISRRTRAERLHRLHAGVYSLIPREALAPEGRWLGGVLACGDGAALSHRSAAALWEILDELLDCPEVTVPIGRAKSVRGVLLHRSRTLSPDLIVRRGIPVTNSSARSRTSPMSCLPRCCDARRSRPSSSGRFSERWAIRGVTPTAGAALRGSERCRSCALLSG
jgi:hypothetical protein